MKEFTRSRVPGVVPDRASQGINGAITRIDRVFALAGVLALGLTAYLAVEPTQHWLLLLLSGLAALGKDSVVRTHPKARFHRLDDTALFLFVPVLFTLVQSPVGRVALGALAAYYFGPVVASLDWWCI